MSAKSGGETFRRHSRVATLQPCATRLWRKNVACAAQRTNPRRRRNIRPVGDAFPQVLLDSRRSSDDLRADVKGSSQCLQSKCCRHRKGARTTPSARRCT